MIPAWQTYCIRLQSFPEKINSFSIAVLECDIGDIMEMIPDDKEGAIEPGVGK